MESDSVGIEKNPAKIVFQKRRILCFKNGKVFKEPKQYLPKIQEVVFRTNEIVQNAFHFLKLLMIEDFEQLFDSHNGDMTKISSDFSNRYPLDKKQFQSMLTVVSSELVKKRGPPHHNKEAIEQLYSRYTKFADFDLLPKVKPSGLGLSGVLAYSTIEMETCFDNNINMHYFKYPKRLLRARLYKELFDRLDTREWNDIKIDDRKKLTADCKDAISQLYKDDLSNCPEHLLEHVSFIKQFLPINDDDLSKNAPKYLAHMIYINRQLELFQFKQYSPIPLRNEFIPKHITIDYAALTDILVDDSNLEHLKAYLRIHDWVLPTKFRKDDLRIAKGVYYERDPTKSRSFFRTLVWNFFTKDAIHTKYKELVFNNMINTNGYKSSVHYADEETHKAERKYVKGIKFLSESDTCEFEYLQDLDEEVRHDIQANKKLLPSDPGKGNLLAIGDGIKGGNSLMYTARQRNEESGLNKVNRLRHRLLSEYPKDSNLMYSDLLATITASSKSCITTTFYQYLLQRNNVSKQLQGLYEKNCFRAFKYTTFLGYRSSEDKFKDRIRKTFDPDGDGSKIVIGYGNWGRNPNALKNGAPTPGIGLRRRIHSTFQTYTINERGTSSMCPTKIGDQYCSGNLEYPYRKMKTIQDPCTGQEISKSKNVHCVLRCKNEKCKSRWWNRDLLGVANQMRQGRYNLSNGCFDEAFNLTTKPTKRYKLGGTAKSDIPPRSIMSKLHQDEMVNARVSHFQ